MKILGISFSIRKDGNCFKTLDYCLKQFPKDNTELIRIPDYNIHPCGGCGYHCFHDGKCSIKDDIPVIYDKCFSADILFFALPTFSGHLPSTFFMFSERSQSIFKDERLYNEHFIKKISYVLIGNKEAGVLNAEKEILFQYEEMNYSPKILILSSKDYNQRSIEGNLIEDKHVKKEIINYIKKIEKK